MKLIKFPALLIILMLSQVNTPCFAEEQVVICSFLSPLSYKAGEWKVRSENGPVYLARWENNTWRVLATFDGTVGKYYLDWAGATPGTYVAVDSFGRCSDSVNVGPGR